eukprot:TRINITY_DN3211_c0_g1_i2.p1 TRINITY_DN3211_c0_g1~~TRINITY_DN3211_c0_g1_i2.p1  ORF type:complete len:601 (-),score=100.92 TRINITY_DN3211_c0_g1_i2:15-1817(-)
MSMEGDDVKETDNEVVGTIESDESQMVTRQEGGCWNCGDSESSSPDASSRKQTRSCAICAKKGCRVCIGSVAIPPEVCKDVTLIPRPPPPEEPNTSSELDTLPEDQEDTLYLFICNPCFAQHLEKPLIAYSTNSISTTQSILLLNRTKIFKSCRCAFRHHQGRDTLSTSYEDDDLVLYFLSSNPQAERYYDSNCNISRYSLTSDKCTVIFNTSSTGIASAHGFIVYSDMSTLHVYHVATKQTVFKRSVATEFLTGQIVYRGPGEDAVYAAASSNDGDVLFYRVIDTALDGGSEIMTLLCRLRHPFAINCPSISPDGNFMACVTDERGLVFIYDLAKIKTRGVNDPILICDYWVKSRPRHSTDDDEYDLDHPHHHPTFDDEHKIKQQEEKRGEDSTTETVLRILNPRRVFYSGSDMDGSPAMSSSWSPDSRFLAVADESGTVVVYEMNSNNDDLKSRDEKWTPAIAWSQNFDGPVRKICFSPSLDVHVLCFVTETAVYFVETRKWGVQGNVFGLMYGGENRRGKVVSGVAWSREGDVVFVGTGDGIWQFTIAASRVGVQSLVDMCVEVISSAEKEVAEKYNWAERVLELPEEVREKMKFKA